MIKIEKLKPFIFYRLSSPVMMYEDQKSPMKHTLISVLAPSIESEIKYLNEISDQISIRYLSRYFIEKFTKMKLYGTGEARVENKLQPIQDVLSKNNTGLNTKNIKTFANPNMGSKLDTLKQFNCLYEINHAINRVHENPKDNRIALTITPEIFSTIDTYLHAKLSEYNITGYTNKVLIIPVNIWVPFESYTLPKFFNTKASKNLIAMIYNGMLSNPDNVKIFKDYKVLLVNYNELMVLDINKMLNPGEEKLLTFSEYLKEFMRKCKSYEGNISQETQDTEVQQELKTAEVSSSADIAVEEILTKTNTAVDTVDAKTKEELTQIVQKEIEQKGSFDVSTADIAAAKKLDDLDVFVKAKMSGTSVENYQRNKLLKEKFNDLKLDGRPLAEIVKDKEKYVIPTYQPKTNTINPGLKELKSQNFEKAYNDQLYDYDLTNILKFFSTTSPELYLISDVVREDVSDTMNKLYKYTVEYEDQNRKRHRFSFLMPKFYKDRYIYLNENKKDITHQKFPFPITKSGPDIVQVCSNYNKIFIQRYGANVSPKMTRLKKVLLGETPNTVKVFKGDATSMNKQYLTTMEYDDISTVIYKMNIGKTSLFFSIADAAMIIGDSGKDDRQPLGINNATKTKYYISGTSNRVYDEKGKDYGELSDFIINTITETDSKFADKFSDVTVGTKFIYSRATMMAKDIPLVIMLSSVARGGLREVLERAKINYEFLDSRENIDTDNKGVVAFADGYLIYDRYPYENSILLNGLSAIPTKEYNFNDMSDRDTYVEIYDTLYGQRNLIEGLENFYQLMIDPITLDVLRRLGQPINFIDVMLYANGLLADNDFKLDSTYYETRLRSNEIVLVYLYQELAHAFGNYRIGKSPKFSIPEDAVIKDLMSAQVIDEHSILNCTLELENDRQVKMKGPVGMNVDEAYTLDKRAFHKSMEGITAMTTSFAAEVGVRRQLTLNYNVVDARGFVQVEKDSYDGTEIMAPSELLNPFLVESADPERVAMATGQSKHLVPTKRMDTPLVSYDMERIVPHLSSDFAYVAKEDGEVLEIANDVMIVKYKSGKIDDIDLASIPAKNSNGGFYIMNNLTPRFEKGKKFKESDVLAYNPKHISSDDEYGDNLMNTGVLARIAFVSNGSVYEDSTYITDELAHDMAAYITIKKDIIISKYSNISYIAKKGQQIKANEPLIIFDDTKDEFTSKLIASMAEEAEDEDQIVASNAPIVAKIDGVISDVKIYYTVPFEEMTPSLQKLISEYNKGVSGREKVISKYMNIKDSNTSLTPSVQVSPDSTGRVKGIKIGDGILIEFYLEYEDIMGIGDKLAHTTALKGIVSYVVPRGYSAYTLGNPDRRIDAFISTIGMYKRMTHDINKIAGIGKILVEKKRLLKLKYYDKLKEESKK